MGGQSGQDKAERASTAVAEAPVPLRRNRDFLLLIGGQAVSALGTRISLVAFPLFVLALSGSPAKAGRTGFLGTLPYPLLYLPAGVLVDRWDRKRVMITADAVRALAFASVPVCQVLHRLTLGQLMAVAFIEGTGFVFFSVAQLAALPNVVASTQIAAAAAQDQARQRGAYIVGQPLGGLLFGLSRALPFLIDAISYLISVVSLVFVRSSFRREQTATTTGVSAAMKEGIAWVWRRRYFRNCILLLSVTNFLIRGIVLVVVVLAHGRGASSSQIGIVLGIGSAAGLAGSFAAPRMGRLGITPKMAVAGLLVAFSVAFFLFTLRTPPLALGCFLALPAFVSSVTNVRLITYGMAMIPDGLLGRVNGAILLVSWTLIPLASLIVGFLLQSLGRTVTPALLGTAAAIVAAVAFLDRTTAAADRTTAAADGRDN